TRKNGRREGIDTKTNSARVYVRSAEARSGGTNSNGRAATEIDRTARNDPISLHDSRRRAIGDGGQRVDHRGNAARERWRRTSALRQVRDRLVNHFGVTRKIRLDRIQRRKRR